MRLIPHRLRNDQSGAVSVLLAVSAIPLVLAIGLAIDAGSLWRASDGARAGADAAAAIAALHKDAGCQSGDAGPEVTADARAAYRATVGEMPASLTVTCTADGAAVNVRHAADLTIMSYVIHSWTSDVRGQSAASTALAGKGWSRS